MDPAPPGLRARVVTKATARPLLTTALLAAFVGACNVLWVSRSRDLGGYSNDEVIYMAKSLRLRQTFSILHPRGFVREVFTPSHTGILVPLLSVPLQVAGTATMTAVMAVQAVLVGIAAIASAGVVNRVTGRAAAVVAGIVMLGLPVMIGSARNFQFAAGLGASMLLAVWALVASERGHRRGPMLAFGAAVGAMLLTRTMAVAFLPAMAVGVVVTVRRDRRVLQNLAWAGAVAVLLAGPWWFRSRGEVFDYLFGSGYGDQAGDYGSGNVLARIVTRALAGVGDLRVFLLVLGIVIVCIAARDRRRWIASGNTPRSWAGASRELAAMAAIVLVGFVTLLTTSNQGIWYELPLELVGVTAVVALAGRLGGRLARVSAVIAVGLCTLTIAVSLTDRGGAMELDEPRGFVQASFSGGLGEREAMLALGDDRFSSNDRAARRTAADEWWAVHRRLVAAIERYRRQGDAPVTVTGGSQLLNRDSLSFAHAVAGLGPPTFDVPDSRVSDAQLGSLLDVQHTAGRRVVVVLEPRSETFPQDVGSARLRVVAERSGWVSDEVIELPDGGRATIMVPPSTT